MGGEGMWCAGETERVQGRGRGRGPQTHPERRAGRRELGHAGGCWWILLEPLAVTSHRILRLMLLHIKYLYGIRVEVRGAHHFPPSQPYVVVSNHQSSLDLLGETLRTHLPQPFLPEPSPGSSLQLLSSPSSGVWPPPPHKQGGRRLVTLPSTWASLALPASLPLPLAPVDLCEVGRLHPDAHPTPTSAQE